MSQHRSNSQAQISSFDRWLRSTWKLYFGSFINSTITVLTVAFLVGTAPTLFRWSWTEAVFFGSGADCRQAGGACWAFVIDKFEYTIFGLYPADQRWRLIIVLSLFAVIIGTSMFRKMWRKELLFAWLLTTALIFVLMNGGILGLPVVATRLWGGLPVTLWLAIVSLAGAYPLGIALALGRRSQLPVIRYFSVAWIEAVRGVPLISILFMAAIIVPLFLPEGVSLDRLVRAQIAFTIFSSAYLAEVFRGGLQAIPAGQYEAANSLGLRHWQTMRTIVLPQALIMVIPGQVNTFISLIKDSALVLVIGIFDFFTTVNSTLGDPHWIGLEPAMYLYAAAIYFILCFSLSSYSRFVERQLRRGKFS